MESALCAGAGAPGLRLIETLRLLPGGIGARQSLHCARMAAGAAALGWEFDRDLFGERIAACDLECGARLRLTLDARGALEVTQSALPQAQAEWRIALAGQRLRSDDPWLTVKSTNRAAYDAARNALPSGVEEVVFANERGEVCDGSITTLFFDRGQGLRTPPLRSGLLPGVLRAEMACPEEVLRVEDLTAVQLWLGNSLRGLMRARFVALAL